MNNLMIVSEILNISAVYAGVVMVGAVSISLVLYNWVVKN